jgi:hypothetical protein
MAGNGASFFEDDEINFVFLIALGGAYDRVADVGAFDWLDATLDRNQGDR